MSFTTRKLSFAPTRTKTVIFSGGMNEAVSNLELKPGELTEDYNYTEIDGAYHGYRSADGYERYDGTALASETEVIFDSEGDVISDINREAVRSSISPVPGLGPVLGVTSFAGELYAFRNDVTNTKADMYRASTGGWAPLTGTALDLDGSYDFIEGRFATYKSNQKCLFWVDGVSAPHTFDGSTVTTITTPVTSTYPTQVGAWKNRLFLAYPGGHLLFSALGDPTDWTTASITGEIFIGDDIEEIIEAPGDTLVVFTKDSININYYESLTPDFLFRVETFSKSSGAIKNSVQRLLGTLYFADDRGITTMEGVETFGDFEASTINKKIQFLYQTYKGDIVSSIVDREKNQYIVYTTPIGGETLGFVFTFSSKNGVKYLKGVGLLKYSHQMTCSTALKTVAREEEIYFGGSEGYVYKVNSGTSFDEYPIITKMGTSFYHYNSPTKWKHFRRCTFEISADKGTIFNFKYEFNYKDPTFPVTTETVKTIDDVAGVWGVDSWGSFTWGGRYVTQAEQKVIGYGTNMRVLIQTTNKYNKPHVIHNMVVEYTEGATRV